MENKKATLLIVDDEVMIRRLLVQKLTKEGYACLQEENTVGALKALACESIDAVILDIRMPGESGLDFLPKLKLLYPDIVIIMATAVTDTSTAIECMRKGSDDYLCKPFNLDEVTITVRRVIEKRRLQIQIREYQRVLEDKVEEQTIGIRKLFLGSIEALVSALEAKDHYTAGHSRRVAVIAVNIGYKLGLSEGEIEDLRWGGLLHDVGKIAVDQMIQNKPGRLTSEEYEHIMIHAHVGAGIVKPVVNEEVVEMIEHHHDHYNGKGLHQTVAGTDIPLAARILAVADAYDAMTSERPYRMAMSIEEAVDEIKKNIGSQFDPVVATAFLQIGETNLASGSLEGATGI
jgi:putative two-component system response regulator